MSDEFYVGYQSRAPRSLAQLIARTAAGIVVAGVVLAAILTLDQPEFAASVFEFGAPRDYSGVIESWPYPMLLSGQSRYLLVAEGKHGLAADGLQGKNVRLKGTLIRRAQNLMLEVVSGSLVADPRAGTPSSRAAVSLGPARLRGEIVDSKCYFGVMNPGEGKVHRDCAARCISGGIPPGFAVRDASGSVRVLLLTGSDGRALNREVRDFVAEPIEIEGELVRSGPTLILKADPRQFLRGEGL